MFILVYDDRLPLALGDGDGDDFGVEKRLFLCSGGIAVGTCSELVLGDALDGVFAAEIFGGLNHAAGNRVVLSAGGLAGFLEAIAKDHISSLCSPAYIRINGVFGAGHRLRAAGDDDIGSASSNVGTCGNNGLQTRSAAAIELHTRHGGGQASV